MRLLPCLCLVACFVVGVACTDGDEAALARLCAPLCTKADACGFLASEDAESCTDLCKGDVGSATYAPCAAALRDLEPCVADATCAATRSGTSCLAEILAYRDACFERSVWGAEQFPVAVTDTSVTVCCQGNDICGWAQDAQCQCEHSWDDGDCGR